VTKEVNSIIQRMKNRSTKQASLDLKAGPLTSLNRCSKNIVIEPIIIAELEFRNVKMQVFLADVVECADNPALDKRPEALNRVGMNRANNILLRGMVNRDVRIALPIQTVIADPLVCAEQANLMRNGLTNQRFKCWTF
jgi:hypothetical protein